MEKNFNQNESSSPFVASLRSKVSLERVWLTLLLAIGVFLRFWHINWGLPELYEEATPLVKAWQMWNFGKPDFDFNPHFFNYPALTFYLHFVVQAIHYVAGYLIGDYSNLQSFGTTLPELAIPARAVTALFDVGTIVLVYHFARRYVNDTFALGAAALIAINPLHINQAHYITVDTPLTFFVLLSLYFMHQIYDAPSRNLYIVAGVSIGLAAATKYTGAFLIPVLLAIHVFREGSITQALRSPHRFDVVKSLLATIVIFLVFNPYILLSFDKFRADFAFEQQHVATGHLGIDSSQATIGYYLLDVLPEDFGVALCILLIASAVLFSRQKERKLPLLFLFPVVYIAIISSWQMRAERYLLPAFPMMILICSIGASLLWEKARSKLENQPGALYLAAIGLTVVVAFQPLLKVYGQHRSLTLPDTRLAAKAWILKNCAAGSVIVTGPYGIALEQLPYRLLEVPFLSFQSEWVASFYDARWYVDCDLVIASDYDYARYAKDPEKYSMFLPYYDSLRMRWKKVFEITPEEYQPGPAFWFYAPPESLKKPLFDPSLLQKLSGVQESLRVSHFLRDLSNILDQRGKPEKLEQILKEIVSVEVENRQALALLGRVSYQLGKYEQALLYAQKSLQKDLNQADLFVLGGEALLKLGKQLEGEISLWKALELDKNLVQAYRDLISLYMSRDDQRALMNVLQKYREVLPDSSEIAKSVDRETAKLRAEMSRR